MAATQTVGWIRSHGRKATVFALFALVLLTALAVASSSKAAVESPPPPQVWSDKADYAPGETVKSFAVLVTASIATWFSWSCAGERAPRPANTSSDSPRCGGSRIGQTQLTWVVDGYTLALACLLLPAGARAMR